MKFPWIGLYLGVGIAVFIAIRFLFKRLKIPVDDHWIIWSSSIVSIVLWPVFSLVSLVWVLSEYSSRREKEKWEIENKTAKRNKYSDFSTEELLTKIEKIKDVAGNAKDSSDKY